MEPICMWCLCSAPDTLEFQAASSYLSLPLEKKRLVVFTFPIPRSTSADFLKGANEDH